MVETNCYRFISDNLRCQLSQKIHKLTYPFFTSGYPYKKPLPFEGPNVTYDVTRQQY